ncbi:MAG TPA: thioredoxin family protein [Spirochaetota bacterium]|nr:thioredoxin family protein [Spirochaetota bacterium]
MLKTITVCILILTGSAPVWAAQSKNWYTDFDKARQKAAATDRHMLLNFNGSDWCGWCIKLREEVFSQKAFLKRARKDFVLVDLDFPRRKELPAALKKQNETLAERYGVKGFPTVLLLDGQANYYARTGYQKGGPVAYYEHLQALADRKKKYDSLLKQAENAADDLQKARLLDKAVMTAEALQLGRGLEKMVNRIKKLDKDNRAGLLSKYNDLAELNQIISSFRSDNNFSGAIDKLEQLAAASGNSLVKQKAYLTMGNLYFSQKKDKQTGRLYFKKAYEAAPESTLGKKLQSFLEK